MNNNYYPQSIPNVINNRQNVMPNNNSNINNLPNLNNIPGMENGVNLPPTNVDYVDNIFRLNIGKEASFYLSYSDSIEWRDKVFTGIIRESGKDYVLLDSNGTWILIWMIYINYVTFNGPINY